MTRPTQPAAAPHAGNSSAPSRSSKLGRRRIFAIAVVAGLVLAGVLAAAVLLGSSAGPPPPTFAEARSEMNRSVAGFQGGGWTLLNALGLDERSGSTVTLAAITAMSGTTCTPGSISGVPLPSSVSVPSFSGNLSSGRAPFWLFLLRQATDGPFLIALVTGGTALPVANLTGAGCVKSASSLSPVATNLVDSSMVAGAAWSAGASGFIVGDPAIKDLVMFATGKTTVDTITFSGWGLLYSPCAPFLSNSTVSEPTYVAAYSSTGTSDGATTYTTDCPAS